MHSPYTYQTNTNKMKKITLFILVGFIANTNLFSQKVWTRIDTNYPGHTIKEFKFLPSFAWYYLDGSNAAIKGIYKSTNDGQSWTRSPLPVSVGGAFDVFKHIHYFDKDEAIIVYYDMQSKRNEFNHTANDGVNQTLLSDTIFSDYKNSGNVAPSPCETSGLMMVDKNFGYGFTFATHVPTSKLTFLITVTRDGCKTWEDISMVFNGGGGAMRQIQFIDPQTGFLSMNLNNGPGESVLKTTDGGTTWDTIYVSSYPKPLVHFINANEGYVSQESPTGFSKLIKTTDGGLNWSTVFDNTKQFHIKHYDYMSTMKYSTEISFADQNNGVFSGRANSGYIIARTSDGGTTWEVDSIVTTQGEQPITKMQLFSNGGSRGIHYGGLYGEGDVAFTNTVVFKVEKDSDFLRLYPNPNNGFFTLESQKEGNGNVYDMTGKLIKSISFSKGINQIKLNEVQGVYYFQTEEATIKFFITN